MNSDEKYLIDNNWIKIREHGWDDKENNFSKGGLTTDYAVKVQKEYDILNRQGKCYIAISNKYGYGWEIKVYTNRKKPDYKLTDYTHLTKEKAVELIEKLNNGYDVRNLDAPFQFENRFNFLLIFNQKDVNRYFSVPTLSHLYLAAIKIFKERVNEGYWYDFDNIKEPIKPDTSEEDLQKIKNIQLKNFTIASWTTYHDELKYYQSNIKEKQLYDLAIKDKKGDIVLKFLSGRKDYEYEGFEIESVEECS